MKRLSAYCILLLAGYAFVSCQHTTGGDGSRIDVVTAFANPAELAGADYFSKVRYVPLETTDESLVGPGADIQFFGDKLVVTTRQKQCLLFEANTGRFVRSLGHIGNDPEGNKSVSFWIDQPSLTLNLEGWNGDWQQYDHQGNYQGKVRFPVQRAVGTNFTYVDARTTVVYQSGSLNATPDSIFFFRDGEQMKGIAAFPEDVHIPMVDMADITSMSVESGDKACALFGPAAISGLMTIHLKGEEQKAAFFDGVTRFWHLGDDLYYKNEYNDTIYQVKDMAFIPSRVFELGAYHWPVSERFHEKPDQRMYISHILENDDLMLCRFTTRLLDLDKLQTYNAMYDKRSGQVKVNHFKEGILDNITQFIPFQPRCVSPSGEFACLLPATDVTTWMDDHTGQLANLPKEVQTLKQVGEEDNPVIVFLK